MNAESSDLPGLLAPDELDRLRAAWSAAGHTVVLTNGCFDLLHVGHVRYLAQARELGDRLVIALNDDASVTRLKGPGRPLQPMADRATILAALRSVDAVVGFGTDTAVELVRRIRPEIYVKGGDYDDVAHRPPEAVAAAELGARVVYLPFVAGRSTSRLVARLRHEES